MQCVWVYNRAIDIDGLRRFHHHLQRGRLSRRIERSPLAVRPPSLGIAQRSARTGDRRDPSPARRIRRLARRAGQHPTGCRARTRMAPCGAALHRRRRRGELGRLPLPHRRRRAAARPWQTRLPATKTQSVGPLPGHGRRWQALREDARQTVRDIPAIGRAVVAAARFARRNRRGGTGPAAAGHRPRPPEPTNASRSQRRRSSSMPTSGTPAHTHSGGPATRCSRHWRPASPKRVGRVATDGSVTLAMPVNERTAGDTRANAITNVDITVDPAPATTDLREIRAAIKASADPLKKGARRTVDTNAPRSPGA